MEHKPTLSDVIERAGGPTGLAARLGVAPTAISAWARVPRRHLQAMAEISGIPIPELMDLERDVAARRMASPRRRDFAQAIA